MRIRGKYYSWFLCLIAVSGILVQTVSAQPRSSENSAPLKIGNITVTEVIKQLGAKLEQGISREQLDNYSRHFNFADFNKDGKHTKEEFVDKGFYLTPQARDGIFRAADENSDGIVTRKEYLLNRIITDEAKAIIQAMDDNENGLVERSEFEQHAKKLLSDHKLATQVFTALDTNSDNKISIPEYLKVWGKWARDGQDSAKKRITAE